MLSVLLKRVFMLKCNLAMLRLTPLLTLCVLPLVLTRLLCHYKRERPPPSWVAPTSEAVVLSLFPIAWFFGFLYYTEVPSLVFVVLSVVAAHQNKHWLSALVCIARHSSDVGTRAERATLARTLARSHQLHVSPNEHRMGALCVCI